MGGVRLAQLTISRGQKGIRNVGMGLAGKTLPQHFGRLFVVFELVLGLGDPVQPHGGVIRVEQNAAAVVMAPTARSRGAWHSACGEAPPRCATAGPVGSPQAKGEEPA